MSCMLPAAGGWRSCSWGAGRRLRLRSRTGWYRCDISHGLGEWLLVDLISLTLTYGVRCNLFSLGGLACLASYWGYLMVGLPLGGNASCGIGVFDRHRGWRIGTTFGFLGSLDRALELFGKMLGASVLGGCGSRADSSLIR